MDMKDETDQGRFQNEYDRLERFETEIGQGQRYGVNMSQAPSSEPDTKHKHKQKDSNHDDHGEREVTDPVTHLPVTIHDFTSQELKNALENIPLTGSQQLRATEVGESPKSRIQLDKATQEEELQAGHSDSQSTSEWQLIS
jgi:hypothetical protein